MSGGLVPAVVTGAPNGFGSGALDESVDGIMVKSVCVRMFQFSQLQLSKPYLLEAQK
jgi:hypothetical protein